MDREAVLAAFAGYDAARERLAAVSLGGLTGPEELNGMPASVVVATTLKELESAARYADTGGGTRLPMRDVIRLAGRSRHYLAVFDDHTEEVLYFGRAKRCATAAQRLALFARDRGCTRPGCTAPFYCSQAHHAERDYAAGGNTDISELALACQPDNNLVEKTEWRTRRRAGRPNGFHHRGWTPVRAGSTTTTTRSATSVTATRTTTNLPDARRPRHAAARGAFWPKLRTVRWPNRPPR